MRVAVIDLGTNTFNLLIADVDKQTKTFNKVFNEKIASKLGRGGINNRIIVPEAFQRGIDALSQQKQIIDKYNCNKIFALATSAIRNAENGLDFVTTVKRKLGISIQVISGDEEAELIYKGNRLACDISQKSVILDIGGGSNEFIIADSEKIYWKQSFEIGMQRLLQMFNPSAPMQENEKKNILTYIDQKLQPLYKALDEHKVQTLIGSSGSFDTFRNLIEFEDDNENFVTSSFEISIQTFQKLNETLTGSTDDELAALKGIDISRIEFLPTASAFVNHIIEKTGVNKIVQSAYSLKEGVIATYIDE